MKKINRKVMSTKKKIFVFFISFLVVGFCGGLFLLYGPLPNFRSWLVTTAMTTMNHQYLATIFYSDEEIEKILAENR